MESGWVHFGGQFCYGKVKRIKFAHHGSGNREIRELNIEPMVARLILGNMATLHEMNTIYSLQDLIYLSEVLDLKEESEYIANRKANGS